MKTTTVALEDGTVRTDVDEAPSLERLDEFDGRPLERVSSLDLRESDRALMQLIEIEAGGSFAMHSSPDVAFCQIVRGRGKLGLPGGREVPYAGPELFIFLPNTEHDWHDIEEDTLMAVCIVKQPA